MRRCCLALILYACRGQTHTCTISGSVCENVFGQSHNICGEYTGELTSELVKSDQSLYLQTTSLRHDDQNRRHYWFIATSSWTQHETDGFLNVGAPGPWEQLAYASFADGVVSSQG